MERVYIVTGAAGFLGNNIVRKLTKQEGAHVRALILPFDDAVSLDGLDVRIYRGDVTDVDSLEEIFDVEDDAEAVVIHCATIVYIKSKYSKWVHDVNVDGTLNVARKALERNLKMVYVNSVHSIPELPNGQTMSEISNFDPAKVNGEYAKTKAEGAKRVLEMVHKEGLNCCIVQPSGIIGPGDFGDSHLTQMVKEMAKGSLPALVKGGYNFVDVRDVASGIISACDKGISGECYILSGFINF